MPETSNGCGFFGDSTLVQYCVNGSKKRGFSTEMTSGPVGV